MPNVYSLQNVGKTLGGKTILRSLTMDIPEGKITSLVGPSGSGKSTLLRMLNRLTDADEGRILYRDQDVRNIDPLALRREAVLIPQDSHMFPGTVRDNILYTVRLLSLPNESPEQYIEAVGMSTSFLDRDAEKLSGGERKRVAIARSLPLHPRVLLMDEPTAGVDPRNVSILEKLVKGMNEDRGTTVVWVTHDVDQAQRVSHHIANLKEGRMVGMSRREDFQWGEAF